MFLNRRFSVFLFLFSVAFSLASPSDLFSIDQEYSAWNTLLKRNVKNGLVDYVSFKKESVGLDNVLKSFSLVTEAEYATFSREEKLCFLINAYNAFTIKLILDHYPVKSIKDIGSILQSPWKREFFELLGRPRNLDWIEHLKLRKEFREPRIHFAINCASLGCPPILNEPFRPGKVSEQLARVTKDFLKDKRKNEYDSGANVLYLSKIFDWFREDFTGSGIGPIDFYNRNAGASVPADAKVKFKDYDWNLNRLP